MVYPKNINHPHLRKLRERWPNCKQKIPFPPSFAPFTARPGSTLLIFVKILAQVNLFSAVATILDVSLYFISLL